MTDNVIKPWDTLRILSAGRIVEAVVMKLYESGRLKVQLPDGHIVVISPDDVTENLGYRPSENERLLRLLIKDRQ